MVGLIFDHEVDMRKYVSDEITKAIPIMKTLLEEHLDSVKDKKAKRKEESGRLKKNQKTGRKGRVIELVTSKKIEKTLAGPDRVKRGHWRRRKRRKQNQNRNNKNTNTWDLSDLTVPKIMTYMRVQPITERFDKLEIRLERYE